MHMQVQFCCCCLLYGYRHPVLDLIVDIGAALPGIKVILLEANNIPSLQTRLPNVRSNPVIHSDAQRASEVARSCTSLGWGGRTAGAVSSYVPC
jgi:hypothetical protein